MTQLDYTPPVPPELTFLPCEKKSCVNVYIVDDCILESNETFEVGMMRTVGLHSRISLSSDEVEITITDNDGE